MSQYPSSNDSEFDLLKKTTENTADIAAGGGGGGGGTWGSIVGTLSNQLDLQAALDAKTDAAVVPNTAPSAGQIPVGNAGGTAYAPKTITTDLAIASTGAATIQPGVVTLAKMADLAQDQFIVRTTASTGVPQTATVTTAARTVLDDATVAAMVDTLGGAASTGTGGLARATSPTFVTPILGTPASGNGSNITNVNAATLGGATFAAPGAIGSGTPSTGAFTTLSTTGITTSAGASVTTANAMGALAIDVTKGLNTKTIAVDSTFTFSGTPATTDTWFQLYVTNSDTSSHTLTIPSSFSVSQAATITTVTIAASGDLLLTWRYNGSTYRLFGDSLSGISDTAFASSWNGVTGIAPSKNAIYDAFGAVINYPLSVYGTGTAYSLTNTAAAVDFGTTDPVKVLDKAGTYLILAQINLAYNGATVVAETATIKVRRTNNTAADISVLPVLDLPVATTLTNTYGIFQIPPFTYSTANTDDSITIFANVSAALGAGTIDAVAIGTSLVALKIF